MDATCRHTANVCGSFAPLATPGPRRRSQILGDAYADLSQEAHRAPAFEAGCLVHPDGGCAVTRSRRGGTGRPPGRLPTRARCRGAPAGVPGAATRAGAQQRVPAGPRVRGRPRRQRPSRRGVAVRLRADRFSAHRDRSGAGIAAAQQAAQIPSTPGNVAAVHHPGVQRPAANYTDPFWSNVGAGFSLVGGRVTALATTPDGAWFAGAADGGVWRSYDQGAHWTPVTDNLPDMSTGALAVDPVNGSLWLGTGEANESQDSYQGDGVWVVTQRRQVLAEGGRPGRPDRAAHDLPHRLRPVRRRVRGHQQRLVPLGRVPAPVVEVLDPAGADRFPAL